MRIQDLPVEAVYDALLTTPQGLSSAEAARRLAEYGRNQVERIAPVSLLRRFARQFIHLFAVVLWLAAAMAFVAETFQPGQGMGTLGIAIILVIVINGSFSFFQEYRSERALESLVLLLPLNVKARRGGELVDVAATELVPGDIVVLEEGNSVPADCRVVRSMGVQVNLASITGESVPVVRDAEADPAAEGSTARNILPAGADIAAGEAEAAIFATGMRTMLGAIAHLTQTAGQQTSPLQKEVIRLSRIISVMAVGSGLAFFAIGMSGGMEIWHASIFAIGLMVANVPEGLLPTVTLALALALAMASRRLAAKNVLVRKLTGVETLGSTTVRRRRCSSKKRSPHGPGPWVRFNWAMASTATANKAASPSTISQSASSPSVSRAKVKSPPVPERWWTSRRSICSRKSASPVNSVGTATKVRNEDGTPAFKSRPGRVTVPKLQATARLTRAVATSLAGSTAKNAASPSHQSDRPAPDDTTATAPSTSAKVATAIMPT